MTENPRIDQPNTDMELHPNSAPSASLVESFGALVDDLRQLYTDVGLRPYRMFSVTYRWLGGEIGRGEPVVVDETEFLPTPKISMMGLRGDPKSAGLAERGDIRVTEISPRYTEDQIFSLFHCSPLPKGYQGFIEVTMDARDGSSPRRRFSVFGVPSREADKFQWSTQLVRQDASRTRSGEPNPVGLRGE